MCFKFMSIKSALVILSSVSFETSLIDEPICPMNLDANKAYGNSKICSIFDSIINVFTSLHKECKCRKNSSIK